MGNHILVMLGGGIGAVLRYLVSELLNKRFELKHWATFWVNITGCFLLGFVFKTVTDMGICPQMFFIVGIIGSYTTFSTFEYENIDLIAHEKYGEFIKYSVFSCFFAFLSLSLGYILAKITLI